METVLLVVFISLANGWCFLLGARVSQTLARGEAVDLPSFDPLASYRQRQQNKHTDAQQQKVEAILRNIDHYDGTDFGQEDIPGGGG